MKSKNLNDLFISELHDIYNAENQLVESLPKLIKSASLPELKETLSHHFKETEIQVTRLETIFSILGVPPNETNCEGMHGIITEATAIIKNISKSSTLDAAIISVAQKVEHYEMASYGTLKSFASNLGLNNEVIDLLQDSLEEESNANKKLTTIANGSFFSTGVNQVAADSKTPSRPANSK